MSIALGGAVESQQRLRMSYEEYLELPEDVRAEYVDGEVIVTPPARLSHQKAEMRLGVALSNALPGLTVVAEAGLSTAPTRKRIPDLMVFEEAEGDQLFAEETPLVVVEILSPSTRNEDVFRKTVEYERAGVGQYWILDRDASTLTVLTRGEDGWEVSLELSASAPRGEVTIGDHGTVELDLEQLLRS